MHLRLRGRVRYLKPVNRRLALETNFQDGLADVVLVILQIGQDGLVQSDPEFRQVLLCELIGRSNVEIRVEAVDIAANRVTLKDFDTVINKL